MRPTKQRVSVRVALSIGMLVAFAFFGVWRWSARDHLGVGLAGAYAWLIVFAHVTRAQHHCQRKFLWNHHMARYTRGRAVALKRKAEANAALAECATGVRARAYHRRCADASLARPNIARPSRPTTSWSAWWDFLQ